VPAIGGRLINDLRAIETNSGTPARVRVGVYDFGNGQRFAATDTKGMPLEDEILYWPVSQGGHCP
jgi:hypothetical protein